MSRRTQTNRRKNPQNSWMMSRERNLRILKKTHGRKTRGKK